MFSFVVTLTLCLDLREMERREKKRNLDFSNFSCLARRICISQIPMSNPKCLPQICEKRVKIPKVLFFPIFSLEGEI